MTDGDRPLDNDWVLGPEPLAWPEGMSLKAYYCCPLCGAKTVHVRDKQLCRKCGYFESCCDGGKESVPGEC